MRDKIRLVSSAGTGYFYTTTKNKRTMPEHHQVASVRKMVSVLVLVKSEIRYFLH